MRARQLWFGAVLVLAGILVLMSNLGYLAWDFWGTLWQIWPVLLISLGVTLLFARSRWVFLGPLILVVAIVYAAFCPVGLPYVSHLPFQGNLWQRSASFARPWDSSISGAELKVELGAGTIDILGSSEDLISGRMLYQHGGAPIWSFQRRSDTAIVKVSSSRYRGIMVGSSGYRGSILLGQMVPWDLKVEMGAGKLNGDFRNIPLQRLKVELGAGNVDLTLSGRGIRGEVLVEGGASSLKLHVPRGVGVRVHITNPVGTNNLRETGLQRTGDYWVSEDYATSPSAYDITISVGVGRVEMDYVQPYPQI